MCVLLFFLCIYIYKGKHQNLKSPVKNLAACIAQRDLIPALKGYRCQPLKTFLLRAVLLIYFLHELCTSRNERLVNCVCSANKIVCLL